MRIKPAKDLVVRDPVTKEAIPEEGVEVSEFDLYWAARLRDGDVLRDDATSATVPPAQEDPSTAATGQAQDKAK